MFCTLLAVFLLALLPLDLSNKIKDHFFLFLFWCWGYVLFFNSRQVPFKQNNLKAVNFGAIFRSLSLFLIQLMGGFLKPSFMWLSTGRVLGDYVGAFFHLKRNLVPISMGKELKKIPIFLSEHKEHFLFLTPHYLCLALSTHMIILFTEVTYGLKTVGFLSLAQRLIQTPLELITSSLFNVTNQRFGELQKDFDGLRLFFLKIVFLSSGLSLFIGFSAYFLIDYLVPILGPQWSNAAGMAKYALPLFLSGLISNPASNFLKFIHQARLILGLEVLELSLKLSLLFSIKFDDPRDLLLIYGFLSISISLIKAVFVYKFAPRLIRQKSSTEIQ
jgi:hypothetical protein